MDWVLNGIDSVLLTPYVYPASIPEDNIFRQALSLYVIVNIGGALVYLIPGARVRSFSPLLCWMLALA